MDRQREPGKNPSKEDDSTDSSTGCKEDIKERQSFCGTRPKDHKKIGPVDVPVKYYGVSFPSAHLIQEDNPLVYEQRADALRAIHQFPGARFREFVSREEALKYASVPNKWEVPTPIQEIGKKSLIYIDSQDLAELQKCIENGDEAMFLERVWSNPRYLVSTYDVPIAIQEELRYNALHIAARSGQTRMFLLILSVIQDKQYLQLLYNKDNPSVIEKRIQHLVDLYLNMPDKVFSETPLHFACKYGHQSIVQIMLSYKVCNVHLQNIDGKCAQHIICEQHEQHQCSLINHKMKILALFEELYYVPVIVHALGITYIGQPCDSFTVLVATTGKPKTANGSDSYHAFAGPAPLCMATRLYENFQKEQLSKLLKSVHPLNLSLASGERVLEKIGRKLCRNFSFGWFEYWADLDGWYDLSSPEGLEYLNKHLSKQDIQINILHGGSPVFIDLINDFTDEFVYKISEIVENCDKLFFFHKLQNLVQHMDCFIKYSYSDEPEIVAIHQEIGRMLYLKITDDNRTNIEAFLALKFFLLNQYSCLGCFQDPKWKMFFCILRFAFHFQLINTMFVKEPICPCEYAISEDCYTYSSKSCYYEVVSLRQEITNDLAQRYEPVETGNECVVIPFPIINMPLSFVVIKDDDGFLTLNETTPPVEQFESFGMVFEFGKCFLMSADGFCHVFRSLIINYVDQVPFESPKSLFRVFQETMKYFKPLCRANYIQHHYLTSLHHEIASCLTIKMLTVPNETVEKWKSYLEQIISGPGRPVMALSQEWMHLLCVIKQFCLILDDKDCLTMCECRYHTRRIRDSIPPYFTARMWKQLRNLYIISLGIRKAETEVPSAAQCSSEASSEENEEFVTPPVSPDGLTKEVYVRGKVFSCADISVYQAVVDVEMISKFTYPYIEKWRSLVASKLRSRQ